MTKRWKAAYVQPRIELCAAEPYKFLAASNTGFNGGHGDGLDDGGGGSGGAGDGGDDGEINGAKFFFENPWDELAI